LIIPQTPNKTGIEIIPIVARPGVISSKAGIDLPIMVAELEKLLHKKVVINVKENKRIDATAQLLASWVCGQLVKRVPFRKAMKAAMQKCLKSGAYGVKIICSGRLGGAEIARREWYREGNLPLNTLKCEIDFARDTAQTAYGAIGVTVYVNYTKKS
jgi:small subunit ribosomal protein S3